MEFHEVIRISQAMSEDVTRLLALTEAEESEPECGVIVQFTANFKNGIEVDIKVCNGDTGPWIDAVIFENGNEIECLPPEFETLEGVYTFNVDDDIYKVTVAKY